MRERQDGIALGLAVDLFQAQVRVRHQVDRVLPNRRKLTVVPDRQDRNVVGAQVFPDVLADHRGFVHDDEVSAEVLVQVPALDTTELLALWFFALHQIVIVNHSLVDETVQRLAVTLDASRAELAREHVRGLAGVGPEHNAFVGIGIAQAHSAGIRLVATQFRGEQRHERRLAGAGKATKCEVRLATRIVTPPVDDLFVDLTLIG